MSAPKRTKKAPDHLRTTTKKWWIQVNSTYFLDDHHRRILTLAGEAWDRCEQAREAIAQHGLTYDDRFGAPHQRPEVQIERDARKSFSSLVKQLGLKKVKEPAPTTGLSRFMK